MLTSSPRPAHVAASLLAFVALSGPPAAGAAARVSSIPKTCPAKAILKRTIQQTVRRVVSRTRPIATVTQAGGFGAPTSNAPGKSSGSERTCTYTTEAAVPVTITFSSPVTLAVFAAARKSTARTTAVTIVRGVGSSAWAMKSGGQLFVLEGTLDIVISAPGIGVEDLAALARAVV